MLKTYIANITNASDSMKTKLTNENNSLLKSLEKRESHINELEFKIEANLKTLKSIFNSIYYEGNVNRNKSYIQIIKKGSKWKVNKLN